MDGPQPVESEQQSPLQENFKKYFDTGKKGSRWSEMAHKIIAPAIINDQNRALFVSEWINSVKSTKGIEELKNVLNYGFDPHQETKLATYLRSKIQAVRPELQSNWFEAVGRVPIPEMALNPEYDSLRKAVGEQLQSLGLTNSGINATNRDLDEVFHFLLPRPYEYFTRTSYRTERVGKLFKKDIKVPVEETDRRIRPHEELLAELFQPTQSLPLPSKPPIQTSK